MYGKIINGEVIAAPEKTLEYPVDGKHKVVCNPLPEHYMEAGYKPVEYAEGTGEPTATEDKIVVYVGGDEDGEIVQ